MCTTQEGENARVAKDYLELRVAKIMKMWRSEATVLFKLMQQCNEEDCQTGVLCTTVMAVLVAVVKKPSTFGDLCPSQFKFDLQKC